MRVIHRDYLAGSDIAGSDKYSSVRPSVRRIYVASSNDIADGMEIVEEEENAV